MACKRLTVQEYQALINSNPNAKGHSSSDCNCTGCMCGFRCDSNLEWVFEPEQCERECKGGPVPPGQPCEYENQIGTGGCTDCPQPPICWCCATGGGYIADAPDCSACCYGDPPINFIDACANFGGTTTFAADNPC